MQLHNRNTIAGAVCRAILRTAADPGYLIAEPAAYKCALIARGADAQTLCRDAARDYAVMHKRVTTAAPPTC